MQLRQPKQFKQLKLILYPGQVEFKGSLLGIWYVNLQHRQEVRAHKLYKGNQQTRIICNY